MKRKIAVIGVGNMAKSIINGMINSKIEFEKFYLFDKIPQACECFLTNENMVFSNSIEEAIAQSDCVLLSVKPQNYSEVLDIIKTVKNHEHKLYISIGAGITSQSVSDALGGAVVIRVLPNLPMTIGMGVSAICKNDKASQDDFSFVSDVFGSAGSVLVINETEMNKIIGVTSSSPAYVFKFINAILKGAEAQGLDSKLMLEQICDVVIGSAELLKHSTDTPEVLISKVASKGGTTERALLALEAGSFDQTIEKAMLDCTARADELGKNN